MLYLIIKKVLCCCRRIYKHSKIVSSHKLPWMWIGDSNHSITEIVNSNIKYNQLIDNNYLDEVSGKTNIQWFYLDSQTLEHKNFPIEGFVIEDDSK